MIYDVFGNSIIAEEEKPLSGLYLSLLGDSISSYVGYVPSGNDIYYNNSRGGVTSVDQMWWKILCDATGMIPLVIDAWSGSAVSQLEDSSHVSKVPMSSSTRCARLGDGTHNPDIILIAGGVNDYTYAMSAQSEPLAWDYDNAPTEGASFTETYACMIKKLQTNYPNAIIVALSTWFTMRGDDNGYVLTHSVANTGNTWEQADYDDAIKNVCQHMRVPYLCVNQVGFNRNNFYPTYATDSSTIPTHPNPAGQAVMGNFVAAQLPAIVSGLHH